jgi:hypothetical protein
VGTAEATCIDRRRARHLAKATRTGALRLKPGVADHTGQFDTL